MSTGIGIVGGLILLGAAIFMGGSFGVFVDPQSIMITVGGTLAATLISFPLEHVLKFSALVIRLFKEDRRPVLEQTVSRLVELGHKASQGSVFSLEKDAKAETDRYMKVGLDLLVQGAPAPRISRRFAIEMEGVKSRHQEGIQLFVFMAKIAPAFGLVGTLIGLINMLRSMGSEITADSLGPNMAVALITTLYGALMAFLFFQPASEKLKAYSSQELTLIRMVREAVLMIKEGHNSRELEEMLNAYLAPKKRHAIVEKMLLTKVQESKSA